LRFQVQTILAVLVLGFLLIDFGTGFGVAEDDHDQQSVIQLTGVLARGVEAGCITLQTDNGSLYNLLNVPLDHPPFGSRVLVQGYVEKNVATTCMQGTPFRVLEIQSISVQTSATTSPLTETSPSTSTTTSISSQTTSTSTTTSAPTSMSSTNTASVPLPWESTIAGIIVGLTSVIMMRRRDRMNRR
jgi:hypothetical protein